LVNSASDADILRYLVSASAPEPVVTASQFTLEELSASDATALLVTRSLWLDLEPDRVFVENPRTAPL
jgi:hypothetical protein